MNNETETNTDTQCVALETRVDAVNFNTPAELCRRIIEIADARAAEAVQELPQGIHAKIVRSLLGHFFGLTVFRALLEDGDIGAENELRLAALETVLSAAGVKVENDIKQVD